MICDLPRGTFFGGSWGTGDSIVFSNGSGGFWRVSANGGDAEIILPHEQGDTRFGDPHILPDDKGLSSARRTKARSNSLTGKAAALCWSGRERY